MTIFNQPPSIPKVTIGIPVYNGARYLRKALGSVGLQSFTNFNVIISDNASTDATNSICLEFAERDNRIVCVRQNSNIGAFDNFKFILNECKSEYFVYLAADDAWHPDFLKKNIEALENNAKAICSASRVTFEKNGKLLYESIGTFPLDGPNIDNFRHYLLRHPNDNSRFYGVFRTFALQKAFNGSHPFYASDWYVMGATLMHGTHIETDEILMYREIAEPDRYLKSVRLDNEQLINRIFPLLPMTCAFIRLLSARQILKVAWPLIRLNYIKHKEYIRYIRD